MSRASVFVFLLQHGIEMSFAALLPLGAVCSWAGRRLVGRWRARALRRRLGPRSFEDAWEGDFVEEGVRVEGHLHRFGGEPSVLGSPPRIGDRVLVWGEPRLGEQGVAYRSASRVLAAPPGGRLQLVVKSHLERWPPSRARGVAVGLPFAAALWMAVWISAQPWVMRRAVIAPAVPTREELARTMSGERSFAPILVGLLSPLAHPRIRRATVDALNRAPDDDSPSTSDEIRALLPLVDALPEVEGEARVRTFLEAGQVERAVEEGRRTEDRDARDLAARAALTFGFFRDAAALSPDRSRVALAAMAGDFKTIRDSTPAGSCVWTWARVRLAEANIEDLRAVVERRADQAPTHEEWRFGPDAPWLCVKLLGDVSYESYLHLLGAPGSRLVSFLPAHMWEVLLMSENGVLGWPQLPIHPRDYESEGASPKLVDERLTSLHGAPRELVQAAHERRASYERRFAPPVDCPAMVEVRYAADSFVGQCLGRSGAVDPFLGEGAEKDGQWASWWQRMFTSRCLSPDVARGSSAGLLDQGDDVQCMMPVDDDMDWHRWWRARARPCPWRTSAQAAYSDLAVSLVQGLAIAKCAGMEALEAELRSALASLQAALDRRETMALLWP